MKYLIHESACSTWRSGQNKGFIQKKDMKFLQVQLKVNFVANRIVMT